MCVCVCVCVNIIFNKVIIILFLESSLQKKIIRVLMGIDRYEFE